MLYSEQTGTAQAEDGTEVMLTVQHVSIDPEVAKMIFDSGIEVGDWYWKHKVWWGQGSAPLALTQAAARFYYGWKEGSEKVHVDGNSKWIYEAWYAC